MYISCPHCEQIFEIIEINCGIFRCGVYISTNEQINPHLGKEDCDQLVKNNLIYGCGKPFQIVADQDGKQYQVLICDYV